MKSVCKGKKCGIPPKDCVGVVDQEQLKGFPGAANYARTFTTDCPITSTRCPLSQVEGCEAYKRAVNAPYTQDVIDDQICTGDNYYPGQCCQGIAPDEYVVDDCVEPNVIPSGPKLGGSSLVANMPEYVGEQAIPEGNLVPSTSPIVTAPVTGPSKHIEGRARVLTPPGRIIRGKGLCASKKLPGKGGLISNVVSTGPGLVPDLIAPEESLVPDIAATDIPPQGYAPRYSPRYAPGYAPDILLDEPGLPYCGYYGGPIRAGLGRRRRRCHSPMGRRFYGGVIEGNCGFGTDYLGYPYGYCQPYPSPYPYPYLYGQPYELGGYEPAYEYDVLP